MLYRNLRKPLSIISALFLMLSLGVASFAQSNDAADPLTGFEQTSERIDPAYAQLSAADLPARQSARQTSPVSSLSSELQQLVTTWQQSRTEAIAQASATDLDLIGDRVHVLFIMLDEAAADSAEASIEMAGGEVTSRYERWIDALVPVLSLETLAQIPGLSLIQRVIEVVPLDEQAVSDSAQEAGRMAGSFLTEGVAESNAAAWQSNGITGTGITVAVLDSFQNYLTAQTNGELPPAPRLTTLGTLNTSSPHGTAVAEIVYDMAPGVSLILVSPATNVEMANRITELANYPVGTRPKVITSSIGFYNAEPGDGTGAVSTAINYAVSQGVLYTQAAGNQALGNWQGTFADTDADNWYNFPNGDEINFLNNGNPVPAGYPIQIFLRWNGWPTTNQDYDLYLFRCTPTCTTPYAGSENVQSGTQPPIEAIQLFAPTTAVYGYAISRFDATGTQILDVMGHNLPTTVTRTADRSLIDPATGTGTFGVAAVYRSSPFALESYSSGGPALGAGGTLAAGNAQPRLASYAVVDTWAYGNDSFNGTSAATPHVAGAAALIRQRFPNYTVAQVKTFLETNAIDMGAVGYDSTYGAGRLYLGASPATINTNVTLQGRPTAPNPLWATTLNVIIKPTGGGAAIFNGTVTTNTSGQFTINPLEPGNYNIWVKHAHTLATLTPMTLAAGPQTINAGTLLEGDANNDNTVTLPDFSILASAFGTSTGAPAFDARADFNGDGSVTLPDFSLLAANFGQTGAVAP